MSDTGILCKSLFASKNDLFMIITAYFDESNTSPNQRAPIVAGYLASKLQWDRFNEQWGKLLRRYKVPIDPKYGERIAHRNKIQHRKDKLFSAWTETHRDNFLDKAYPMIRRHTRMPIGNAVFRKEFEQIVPKDMQKAVGGAYGWCVYSCLYAVKWWCDRNNYKEPVNYIFEEGALGSGQVYAWFNGMRNKPEIQKKFRLGTLSFAKKTLKPLQAADFLAYDLGRYALDVELGRTKNDVNTYLHHLLGPTKPIESKVAFWDGPTLKSLIEKLSTTNYPS